MHFALANHTFDAIEIIAFFRALFPSAGISSKMGFGNLSCRLSRTLFLATRARSLCTKQHVENVVYGDRATFIMWAPDFGPSSSTNGSSTAVSQGFRNGQFADAGRQSRRA